jgi:hypothetical protein
MRAIRHFSVSFRLKFVLISPVVHERIGDDIAYENFKIAFDFNPFVTEMKEFMQKREH